MRNLFNIVKLLASENNELKYIFWREKPNDKIPQLIIQTLIK